MPPSGRIKNPTPKVAVVSNNEAYWLPAGKNKRAMMTVKNPKTMKSYHSSALPITAAAIWNGFGANGVGDMISPNVTLRGRLSREPGFSQAVGEAGAVFRPPEGRSHSFKIG